MANLKEIKKRIGTVKNTRQITKAMKMVSAAKLRRAQDAVVAARPYADKMSNVLASLAMREDSESHPLLLQREKKRALVVLMTADRGLCGGFNANISKTAERFIRKNEEDFEQVDLMIIGRKGNEYLKRRPGMNIVKVHENIMGSVSYSTAALLGQEIVNQYQEETYDVVYLAYNAFRSAISQEPTLTQVLPVVPRETVGEETVTDYLYEPHRSEVLEQLLPKNVEVQIFRALLESVASEHGARMSAMDSASKNASEMIGRLTLQYNRARQAAITKELMEIISGAESIK
ncbi:ATP synthase F1 subunit gamma [Geoalkalibacter subterraneus]|uniref:ATP synthase gamma chain n=1 Tax=Geoalkalibacter subterraneus TaxID=483547 RepID=A0A0B5FHM1_9BACT|nr:ATP synthase F1 subunit gamma [Geoalkalibacter subterraneus]AJF07687.1 ATP F0F1 synthase subunit gamma [Geoalkalibacter subterraneus]